MKKLRKSVESYSIRVYELVMRKRLLKNFSILAIVAMGLASIPSASELTPHFLIFSEEGNVRDIQTILVQSGSHIRHIIPPHILVVDIPSTVRVSSLSYLKNSFVGPIPIPQLESLGPVAVSAGLQWNKDQLKRSKRRGQKAVQSMTEAVSMNSLDAPILGPIHTGEASVSLQWQPVSGASYYLIQLAKDAGFNFILGQSQTDRTSIDMPVDTNLNHLYLRVRALDRTDPQDATLDIGGKWTSSEFDIETRPQPPSESKPILTSPYEGFQSVGFTVVLEWVGEENSRMRVQISKTENFSDTLIDEIIPRPEFIIPSPVLHMGDRLYWRVSRWNPQRSSWSMPRQFLVGAPEAVPHDMLVNPERPQ